MDPLHVTKTQPFKPLIAIIAIFLLSFPPQMLAASITDLTDLTANSTVITGSGTLNDTYLLNGGNHTISSGITPFSIHINNPTKHLQMNAAGGTLTIGSAANHNDQNLFQVQNFTINAGTLNSAGGVYNSLIRNSSFRVTGDLTQIGGSIIGTAGIGNTASGIIVDGFATQSSGTVTGQGGNSAGIFVFKQFTQTGTGAIIGQGGNGTAQNAHGLSLSAGLSQANTGSIHATGGGTRGSFGVHIQQDLTQADNGITRGFGGIGTQTHGIYVGRDVSQTGNARIEATGSTISGNGAGVYITRNLAQSDTSTILANGGAVANAQGMAIGQLITQKATSSIVSVGGSAANSYGMSATNLIQQGNASITATAGTGATAHGMIIGQNVIQQDNAVFTALGGSAVNSRGLLVTGENFTQNNFAQLIATGGSIGNSHGVQLSTGDLVQNDTGLINATGGSATNAYGIFVNNGDLVQNGGTYTSIGGTASGAYGTSIGKTALQATGTITATGSATADAHGMVVTQSFTQQGGILNANAGGVANTCGLWVKGAFHQQGGTINATGGLINAGAGTAQGIWANSSFYQTNTAQLIAQGGVGVNGFGLSVRGGTGTLAQAGNASIQTTGGSAINAAGIASNHFTQTDFANLIAVGGSFSGAHGISVGQNATQQGNAIITATGGAVTGAHGMQVDNTLTQSGLAGAQIHATGGNTATGTHGININTGKLAQNGAGTINATGGTRQDSYGIYLRGNHLEQSGSGSINATGGTALNAFGIRINPNFDLVQADSAQITALAGSGTNAHGISIGSRHLLQADTTSLIATGGSGASLNAYGINLDAGNIVQAGTASIVATGGAGINAHAINLTAGFLNQSDTASITATGGTSANTYGINIATNAFTQHDTSTATTTGGTGQNAYGLFINNNFTQNDSAQLTSTGGTGHNAYGAWVGDTLMQNSSASSIIAQAGTGADAHGLFVNETASFAGNIHLDPTINPHVTLAGSALYIHNSSNVATAATFTASSKTGVTLDANTLKSGLMQVNQGNTLITAGATVQLDNIDNIYSLTLGQKYSSLFLEHIDPASVINGTFTLANPSLTTTVGIEKQGNDYYVTYTRDTDLITLLDPKLFSNEEYLIKAFPQLAGLATPESLALRQYADLFENSTSLTEAKNTAHVLQRNLTPHAFTRVPRLAVQNSSFVRNAMYANLETPRSIKFKNSNEVSFSNNIPSFMNTAFTSNRTNQGNHNNQGSFLLPPSAQAPSTAFVTKPTLNSVVDTFTDNDFSKLQASVPLLQMPTNYTALNAAADATPDAALYSHADFGWQLWLDTYGQIGSMNAHDREFVDADQKTAGLSLGVRRTFEPGHSMVIVGHYLYSSLNSNQAHISNSGGQTDITMNTAGASVGARFLIPQLQTEALGTVAPYIDLTATYSALDIEQERYVFGTRLDSDTTGNMYQAGAMMFVPVQAANRLLITPEFGATYSFVDIKSYSESNKNSLGLDSEPEDYSSLLLHLGIRADVLLAPQTVVYGSVAVSHDVLDEDVTLNNSFRSASQVQFKTAGEYSNNTTTHLRAGVNTHLWNSVYLNSEYTFALSQENQSHSLGLNFSIGF